MQTPSDGVPLLRGVGGHGVVDTANCVQTGFDAVEAQQVVTVVVGLDLQPQQRAHRSDGDAVDLVGGGRPVQLDQGVGRQLAGVFQAGGGEVVVLVLAHVGTQVGRQGGAGLHQSIPVAIGDDVDLGVGVVGAVPR